MMQQQVITMKMRILVSIGLSMALAGSVWADEALDPAQLAQWDAMLASCQQLYPGGAAAYKRFREAMIGNAPEGAVEVVTQTPEYRDAFEAARQKIEAKPQDATLKECTQLVASMNRARSPVSKSTK